METEYLGGSKMPDDDGNEIKNSTIIAEDLHENTLRGTKQIDSEVMIEKDKNQEFDSMNQNNSIEEPHSDIDEQLEEDNLEDLTSKMSKKSKKTSLLSQNNSNKKETEISKKSRTSKQSKKMTESRNMIIESNINDGESKQSVGNFEAFKTNL